MRREIITWSVVLGVILTGFGITVLILNSSLYSASGFVRGYLDSLARHDTDGALELAGTIVVGDASDELLTASAMGELSDIRLLSDDAGADGVHSVVYGYSAGGVAGQSTFEVRRQGTLLGLFPTWAFDTSPLGVIQLSVLHGSDFTANGVDVAAPRPDQPAPYLVFTPGTYLISHDSTYLHADPIEVTATEPGAAVPAELDIGANAAFAEEVRTELKKYLDECATQEVLLPTGCPFGQVMGNRIITTPQWSMSSYPRVTIEPGVDPGTWLMPSTGAAAHLVVDVRSLFDGSVSTFDEDVPFTASYVITFLPGDKLLITAQYS